MQDKFVQLKNSFEEAMKNVSGNQQLETLRHEFLGRKGKLADLMKEMVTLSDDQKKAAGKIANELKIILEKSFAAKESEVRGTAEIARLQSERIDISEPGLWPKAGHLHPVSAAIAEIEDIFSHLGFSRVRAPEVDWDYYAFESLNMPPEHPARDDWETFFIATTDAQAGAGKSGKAGSGSAGKGKIVLTPHTSNSQVREMEKGRLPIRMINLNRNYRRESGISHIPMFHQFEGLLIDEGVTIAHLKGVLNYFAQNYFGKDRRIRLRPHHFRFTEPSFEVDISCGLCGGKDSGAFCRLCKSGWLELGGAGMVHPNVLKAGGLNPDKIGGFAFGWGVERTLMMKSGMKIDDIRILYKGDLNFVTQF